MTRSARKEGLSRRHRFAGRGCFSIALRSPDKLRGKAMILHIAAGRPGESRLGIAIPKRLARRSVDRSRIKRLVRETFRRHPAKRAGLDLVLAPRREFSGEEEAAWLLEVRQLLDRVAGNN